MRMLQGCWRVMSPGVTTTLAISRALGDRVLKTPGPVSAVPFTCTQQLSPRDRFVILASDGLWDVVDDAQAVKIASQAAQHATGSPSEAAVASKVAAECLMQRAVELGSQDNITVLVVMLLWE